MIRQYIVDALIDYDNRITTIENGDNRLLIHETRTKLSDLINRTATDNELIIWANAVGFKTPINHEDYL